MAVTQLVRRVSNFARKGLRKYSGSGFHSSNSIPRKVARIKASPPIDDVYDLMDSGVKPWPKR